MNRRKAITILLGGAIAVWPFRSVALPSVVRLGVIMNYAEADPEGNVRLSALLSELKNKGWMEGDNLHLEVRWPAGRSDLMLADATEIVKQPVDIIVANSTPLLSVLKQATTSIPIVFTQVADPVGSGFIGSYARPGGNITGFTDFETSVAGKWLEILREVAPGIRKATVLLDRGQKNHPAFLHAIEAAGVAFGVEVVAAGVQNRIDIEGAINALHGETDRGLIVLPGPLNNTHRGIIIQLATRLRLPTVYPFKYYATDGGLVYYGIDQIDQWRKAASYVDRILHGEKPSDLPAQTPTKFNLVINLKAAKALGLSIPPTLLATADEVIE
jgi:putative ABC transport system substrate-binding protein